MDRELVLRAFEIIDDASSRFWPVSLVSIPGPINPSPPALDTATASAGPAITAMGAFTRNGLVTHGKADRIRVVILIGIDTDVVCRDICWSSVVDGRRVMVEQRRYSEDISPVEGHVT